MTKSLYPTNASSYLREDVAIAIYCFYKEHFSDKLAKKTYNFYLYLSDKDKNFYDLDSEQQSIYKLLCEKNNIDQPIDPDRIIKFTIPDIYVNYLINGDSTSFDYYGIDPTTFDQWLEIELENINGIWDSNSISDPYFSHTNDFNRIAGSVVDINYVMDDGDR